MRSFKWGRGIVVEGNSPMDKKNEISEEYETDVLNALNAAKLLFKHGFYKDAINRAYYSSFNMISSLLVLEGLIPKTRKGQRMNFIYILLKLT